MRLAPLLAAAALAGCGVEEREGGVAGVKTVRDSPAHADAFATMEELAWIRRFSGWAFRFSEHSGKVRVYESGSGFEKATAGDEAELRRYRRLLEPFRACEDGFLEQVGRAPTQRLQPAERNLVAACRLYRGGIDLLLRAMDGDDPGLAQRARYKIEDGNLKLGVAAGVLPPGEKQRLPVARGATGKSRVDPHYGEIASGIAEKEIEARCWSRKDWTKLLVEEKALTGGTSRRRYWCSRRRAASGSTSGPSSAGTSTRSSTTASAPAIRCGSSTSRRRSVRSSTRAGTPRASRTSRAECEAIQLLPKAAQAARVEPAYTRELTRLAWESYPGLPAEYRSAECRDGGKLDLTPGDGRFP